MSLLNVEAAYNWDNIVKLVKDADVFESEDGDVEYQRIYLGSIFTETPSGKMYTPFANSNVDVCPQCKGDGHVNRLRLRTMKKRESRFLKHRALVVKRGGWSKLSTRQQAYIKRTYPLHYNTHPTCPLCHGVGSREAYEDEVFHEQLEEAAEKRGLFVEYGDGDIFICRTVDETEEEVL